MSGVVDNFLEIACDVAVHLLSGSRSLYFGRLSRPRAMSFCCSMDDKAVRTCPLCIAEQNSVLPLDSRRLSVAM